MCLYLYSAVITLTSIRTWRLLSWKPHVTHISNLITKSVGVLNRLKHILPTFIKLMIYNSLILSRINYGILAWGYNNERIFKLQKKAVRLITLAKFNAHSEPIFKSLNLLKVQDIFEMCQMEFYHNSLNKKLPHFFNQISFQNNNQIHRYETGINAQFHLPKIKHSFAKLCIRNSLPSIINNALTCVTEEIKTHSLNGFTHYGKSYII